MESENTSDRTKRAVHRSPSYPSIPLEEALKKLLVVYKEDKRAFTSRSVILRHLGFTDEKSGAANRTLSALRQYSLLEERDGQVRVSDGGYSLLFLSENSPDRLPRLREAALSPKIFKELWDTYGPDLASDETLSDFLVHKREFNPASVSDVVSAFRKTIIFAKLQENAIIDQEAGDASKDVSKEGAQVGDYVQWESQGVQQFNEPRRVRELSEDGRWAFVEGSNTGMPVGELTVEEARASVPPDPTPRPRSLVDQIVRQFTARDTRQDVFSLPEGPVTIQWPANMSTDSFEDLSAWIDILKRKIGRSVKRSSEDSKGGE
jgi:hypothetical protein